MKKLLIVFLPFLLVTACVDSLDDYNVDQKRAGTVTPETLYTSALKSLMDIVTTPNVNSNNFRLYTQYWTTTSYLDEPRYGMTARLVPQNFWDAMYRDVIYDLKTAKSILEADQFITAGVKVNQMAQLEIIEVYAWAALVNTFGNIPYKQAMDIENSLPEYDDASAVYLDLLDRMDAALSKLTTTSAGFGAGELLYASKAAPMVYWVKFGNSVKLKLAMVLADVNTERARLAVQQAFPNTFESNTDNARFPYINDPPNNNPVSANVNAAFTSRTDFIPANTIVNKMAALGTPVSSEGDPRMPFYFTKIKATVGGVEKDIFKGGLYGFQNDYKTHSKVQSTIIAANFEALLLDNAEVQFFLAEAVERGFLAGLADVESAETYYNRGITASMQYWGVAQTQIDAYLVKPEVAYATAAGDYKQKIGEQKWIALFNRGWDAWVEWKRLDYPVLAPPTGPEITRQLFIPVRLIYPINEQTLNGANREKASSAIGGDVATTKLFWDIH